MIGPRGIVRLRLLQQALRREVGDAIQFQARGRFFRLPIFRGRVRRANFEGVRSGRYAITFRQVVCRAGQASRVCFTRLATLGPDLRLFSYRLVVADEVRLFCERDLVLGVYPICHAIVRVGRSFLSRRLLIIVPRCEIVVRNRTTVLKKGSRQVTCPLRVHTVRACFVVHPHFPRREVDVRVMNVRLRYVNVRGRTIAL